METNRLNQDLNKDDGTPLFADLALRSAIRKVVREAGANELDTKQMACVEAFVKANCSPGKSRPGVYGLALYFTLETERDSLIEAIKDHYPDTQIDKT